MFSNDLKFCSEKEILNKLDKCVKDLIESRTPLLKKETKNYVLERIYKDMECIIKLIDSTQTDFLANQLNDIDLTIITKGPQFNKKKYDKIDTESNDTIEIDQYSAEIDEEGLNE